MVQKICFDCSLHHLQNVLHFLAVSRETAPPKPVTSLIQEDKIIGACNTTTCRLFSKLHIVLT